MSKEKANVTSVSEEHGSSVTNVEIQENADMQFKYMQTVYEDVRGEIKQRIAQRDSYEKVF